MDASQERRNGRCQRRTDARQRAFPREVRMFVDYLVTGIPGVGYGDSYKGRAEVVSGVATNCRMMCVQPYGKAGQRSSLLRRDSHTALATFHFTMPARFSATRLHNDGSRRFAGARGNGNSWL